MGANLILNTLFWGGDTLQKLLPRAHGSYVIAFFSVRCQTTIFSKEILELC